MYRYQIKKGEEHLKFGGDGVRNIGDGTVESDHELTNPHLKPINDAPAQPPAASVSPPSVAPASQPSQPASPPQNTQPQGVR